jgi:hypothetical protein
MKHKRKYTRRNTEPETGSNPFDESPVAVESMAVGTAPAEDEAPPGKRRGLVQETVIDGDYHLNIVKDYDEKIDPFYLSRKDPDFEYRFLRDDKRNLNIKTGNLLFQKGGWQICPPSHLDKLGIKIEDRSPDGLLRRGDTILAFMPMKLFKEKEAHRAERAKSPIEAVERNIKHGDPENPELFGLGHPLQRGLQTAKQLGMKA